MFTKNGTENTIKMVIGAIEIIFPVAEEAVSQTDSKEMPIVPGVAAGEGCSTAGGCANCPFMKMNDLDALVDGLDITISL